MVEFFPEKFIDKNNGGRHDKHACCEDPEIAAVGRIGDHRSEPRCNKNFIAEVNILRNDAGIPCAAGRRDPAGD